MIDIIGGCTCDVRIFSVVLFGLGRNSVYSFATTTFHIFASFVWIADISFTTSADKHTVNGLTLIWRLTHSTHENLGVSRNF